MFALAIVKMKNKKIVFGLGVLLVLMLHVSLVMGDTGIFYSSTADGYVLLDYTDDFVYTGVNHIDVKWEGHVDIESVGYIGFDTSSIPDNAAIESATLSLYKTSGTGTVDLGVYTDDWGPVLEIEDYSWPVAGDMVVQFRSYDGGVGYNDMPITDLSVINKTGATYFAVSHITRPSGDDLPEVVFSSGEVSAQAPKLTVIYSLCVPPVTGDWVLTQSCTMPAGYYTVQGGVIVNSPHLLTISSSTVLYLDFVNNNLLVMNGAGVLVKNGGRIT